MADQPKIEARDNGPLWPRVSAAWKPQPVRRKNASRSWASAVVACRATNPSVTGRTATRGGKAMTDTHLLCKLHLQLD
ncbi:hypothetical protein SAMN04488527_11562 [Aliiroseovarius crassostreae]|nr:hypothetical protein SAMN04488527_11562 [Aliiroseovarius crassostreae]